MIIVEEPFNFTICWSCESGLIYLKEEITEDFEGEPCVLCVKCGYPNEVPHGDLKT